MGEPRPMTRTQILNWRTVEAMVLLPVTALVAVLLFLLGAFVASSGWNASSGPDALARSAMNVISNVPWVLSALAGLAWAFAIDCKIRCRATSHGP